ncbi:hypothetical protein [Hymenobacter cellulosilyticus]|uniref:Uncharacterized protein n=1 Tax=Hymenobacter cellulosilyticus TaxID=2932248 RepID=A0A8T9QBI3_9BACT|nr:hypothetical protein [Hymenobacter cellulosilyticus]UOQ74924.1 hypothetical protein MUN79_14270 [Hymenobacter cellulosilyticus]
MIKLYLDIDGVLLTTKHTQAASGVEEFVEFVTSSFECYWLTTHCKGSSASALRYLSRFLPPSTLEQLEHKVKPTDWDTLKTEAIDVQSNFYWLDDQPFQAEKAFLQANRAAHRLIVVDLKEPDALVALQLQLQTLLQFGGLK